MDIEPFSGLSKESRSLNLEIHFMLLLLSSLNTWAAQNSSWSAHIIVFEVSCGPWNAQVGWQVAYLDLKLRFTLSICNLPANPRIPRATLDFRKNDFHRSWTVSRSPCIHFVSEVEHWKTILFPIGKKKKSEFLLFLHWSREESWLLDFFSSHQIFFSFQSRSNRYYSADEKV